MPDLDRTAREASIADYVGEGPALADAFQGLTMGETHRYYVQACRTVGAIYESHVSRSEMAMKVTLPEDLALNGLTATEAASMERYLHNEMEKAIVWCIRNHKAKHGGTCI